nr:MAG TPA: hypothetical protein [Caudoviricetes sp.]DAY97753.1 MAG TPA: hypothetical protein [Caudoviricetes sp.]
MLKEVDEALLDGLLSSEKSLPHNTSKYHALRCVVFLCIIRID